MAGEIQQDRDLSGTPHIGAALAEVEAERACAGAKAARQRCRALLRDHPDSVDLMLALARLELESGNPGGALEVLSRAGEQAPERADVWMTAGDALLSARAFEQAAGAYRRARNIEPARPHLAARLGAALQAAGRVDAALDEYRAALERTPDDAMLHYNLGTALKQQHRFDEAVQAYSAAARLAPGNADLALRLGNLLVETSRFEDAIEPLTRAVTARPPADQRYAYHLLAYAHKKLKQGEESVAAAKRLLELTGGALPALMHLSAAYLTQGDAEAALAVCRRGLEREPASRQLLSDQAIALAALGCREQAARLFDLEHLLDVSPIEAPPGFDSVNAFNAALVGHIDAHPTLDFSGISLSCHRGATSDELLVEPKGPVAALEEAIRRAAERYVAGLDRGSGQPWVDHLPAPERLELSAWVTRLKSQGYQHGHIHPSAWISGVYYVSLPREVRDGGADQAGWIEFGRPPYYYAASDGHDIRAIRPHEGMLVLFPSYFYHRTIPFESSEDRITIAFDFRRPAQQADATSGT